MAYAHSPDAAASRFVVLLSADRCPILKKANYQCGFDFALTRRSSHFLVTF
jgi:hypothetical protein